MTTRIAAPGEYAVVTHVQTVRDERACQGGWRESYAGHVRTTVSQGSRNVVPLALTLWGCPGAYPSVGATTTFPPTDRGRWEVSAYVLPDGEGARVAFTDESEQAPPGWDDLTQTHGPLYREDTGVAGHTQGTHHWCGDQDRGNTHGCLSYDDTDVTINFDSSISGHWARFYITSFGKGENDTSSSESRSEPYGNGGWKITRLS